MVSERGEGTTTTARAFAGAPASTDLHKFNHPFPVLSKPQYNLPIIYFILGKYAIAVFLTIITDDAITAVAWDSAGVTTGPVTVPFVLAIGIGFAQAVSEQCVTTACGWCSSNRS